MSQHDTKLPSGWKRSKIRAIGEVVTGSTPSKQQPEYYGGKIPFYKPTDLNAGYFVKESSDHLSEEGAEKARLLPAGSVLVTCIGATIGKTGLARVAGATNQQINAVVPSEGMLSEFLFWFFVSSAGQKAIIGHSSATTLPILNKGKFSELYVPVAPLHEQRRIVARIEELFSRLDAGVAALRHAKAQLQRYRQSVLAAAVTGQLTQAWREQHPTVAPQGKSKDLFGIELPPTWQCIPLSKTVDEGPRNGYSPKCGNDSLGSKVLKLSATSSGQMLLNEKTTKVSLVPVDPSSHAWLKPKDVLIQRANTLELLGSTAIYDGKPDDYVFPDLMMRVRVKEDCTRKLLVMFLNSLPARNYFQRNATGVAGNMPKINGATVKALPVPLPPLAEQHQIVAEVEARITSIDHLEAELDRQIIRSNHLRQSTLAAAFAGNLIPNA